MKIQLNDSSLSVNLNNFEEIFGEEYTGQREVTLDGDLYRRTGECGDYIEFTLVTE